MSSNDEEIIVNREENQAEEVSDDEETQVAAPQASLDNPFTQLTILMYFIALAVSNLVLFNTCRAYMAQSVLPTDKRLPFSSIFILQIMHRIGLCFSDTPNPVIPQALVYRLFRLLVEWRIY